MSETAERDVGPVRVEADLDGPLSRWLWVVKWLLAIPHYVILWLLSFVYAVLSVAALVAILITGRYPRAIFEFNLGCCAGAGGWPTTPTARWAPTGTRPSPWPRSPTTRPA